MEYITEMKKVTSKETLTIIRKANRVFVDVKLTSDDFTSVQVQKKSLISVIKQQQENLGCDYDVLYIDGDLWIFHAA